MRNTPWKPLINTASHVNFHGKVKAWPNCLNSVSPRSKHLFSQVPQLTCFWKLTFMAVGLSSGAWLAFVVLTIVNPTPMNWKLLSRPNQFSLVTIGFDLYRIFGTFWNIELSNPWVGCCIFWSIQLFLLCISCHTYHISFYTILLHISWWYGITYRPIEIYLYHPHDISEPS